MCVRLRNLKSDAEIYRHCRSCCNILREVCETVCSHIEVIRVERNIGQSESTGIVGVGCAVESADRIMDFNGRIRNYGSGWAHDGTVDRAGVPVFWAPAKQVPTKRALAHKALWIWRKMAISALHKTQ